MTLRVRVLRRAQDDITQFASWIERRSVRGLEAWYLALYKAIRQLRDNPVGYAFAHEAPLRKREIRQALFKTRSGNRYRILFVVIGDEIRLLRVRGSGQRLLSNRNVPVDDSGDLIDPIDDLH